MTLAGAPVVERPALARDVGLEALERDRDRVGPDVKSGERERALPVGDRTLTDAGVVVLDDDIRTRHHAAAGIERHPRKGGARAPLASDGAASPSAAQANARTHSLAFVVFLPPPDDTRRPGPVLFGRDCIWQGPGRRASFLLNYSNRSASIGFDARGLGGGVEAEGHADGDRDGEREQHRREGHLAGHPSQASMACAAVRPTKTPSSPPPVLQQHRLHQELEQDVPPRAPTAFRMPISRVRSVTETSMMFMIPIPPTTSDTAGDPARGAGHRVGSGVAKLGHLGGSAP